MVTGYTLEWRNGRKEQVEFVDSGYFYVFPDRTRVNFQPRPAWCHSCRKFTLCECHRTEAAIREELAEVSNPASVRWQRRSFTPLSIEERIVIEKRILEDELRHILVRTLPPSCLSCGGRLVSFLKFDEWTSHPDTGEDFRLSIEGWGTGINRVMHFYDVNGHALELRDAELEA